MQSIGRQSLARVGADESGTACYQDRLHLVSWVSFNLPLSCPLFVRIKVTSTAPSSPRMVPSRRRLAQLSETFFEVPVSSKTDCGCQCQNTGSTICLRNAQGVSKPPSAIFFRGHASRAR